MEKDLQSVFNEKWGLTPVIFCDQCNLLWPRGNHVDIVFLGNLLSDFSYIHYLPKNQKYRIWTLSQSFARRLSNIYGLNLNDINVVDRYSLYSRTDAVPLDIQKAKRFIYSGRASTLKNFKLIVSFLNYLGSIKKEKLALEICAPLFKKTDFKVDKSVQWVNFVYHGDLGESWVNSVDPTGAFLVNFSFDPFDDFNLSLAQWQNAGGATLTHSSAFCSDISGENCFKINSSDLIEFFLSPTLARAQIMWEGCYLDREEKIFNNVEKYFSRDQLVEHSKSISTHFKTAIESLNTYEFSESIKELLLNDSLS